MGYLLFGAWILPEAPIDEYRELETELEKDKSLEGAWIESQTLALGGVVPALAEGE